jgi:hypothetical protein
MKRLLEMMKFRGMNLVTINVAQIQENTDGAEIFGTLTLSGAYATGGDVIDWTTVAGVSTENGRTFTPSKVPYAVQIDGTTGDTYGYVASPNLNGGKVKINTASNTELGAGAYNARFTGDVNIFFDAAFPKLF